MNSCYVPQFIAEVLVSFGRVLPVSICDAYCVLIRRDVDGSGDVSPSLLDALELLTVGAHAAVLRSIAGGAKFMPSIRAATSFAIDEASLIEVLKQLAQCGAISRLVHAGPPLRVEYELTDSGLRLDALIVSAREWIERWT